MCLFCFAFICIPSWTARWIFPFLTFFLCTLCTYDNAHILYQDSPSLRSMLSNSTHVVQFCVLHSTEHRIDTETVDFVFSQELFAFLTWVHVFFMLNISQKKNKHTVNKLLRKLGWSLTLDNLPRNILKYPHTQSAIYGQYAVHNIGTDFSRESPMLWPQHCVFSPIGKYD